MTDENNTNTHHRTPEHERRIVCSGAHTIPRQRIKGYGWRPDKPDARDIAFNPRTAAKARGLAMAGKPLPRVDLRESGFMPPIYDQGNLGSCTGNGSAGAFEYEQRRQGLTDYLPSRLFIYYNERAIEGTIGEDAGAEIRDALKVLARLGAPHETLWPYDINRFAERPPQPAFDDGIAHQCLTYARVPVTTTGVKSALCAGVPVVIGFTVYESFEDTPPGGVVVPDKGQIIGGHCVCIVGYETLKTHRNKVYAIVRNSWGTSWADAGYCYMPLAWLCNTNNADDFWAVQQVESPSTRALRYCGKA
jgi:C1A family cysteine protease